jgi:hypothetical protein
MNIHIILYTLFFFLIVIEMMIDFTSLETRKCLDGPNHKEVRLMLIFHHILSTFLLYGWLLPNKNILLIYIISSLMMFAEWEIYGHCRLTEYVNLKCDGTNKKPFRDLLWKLGTKQKVLFYLENRPITLFHIIVFAFLVFGVIHYVKMT